MASTPLPVMVEQGEGAGGVGSAPEQPTITSGVDRKAELEPAIRKAYLAFQYAETMRGRRLEDREAYDWLKENGIDPEKGDLGELTDYQLPDSFETFKRYVVKARGALGESKYTGRAGRKHGKSVVWKNQIE